MEEERVIISCNHCGAKNRMPKARLKDHPICGKCRATIEPEVAFIKCGQCGAKNRIIKALMKDHPNCGKCHEPLPDIPVTDYVVEVMDRTFPKEVASFPGPVLLEFYSNSCGYCHQLLPTLQQMAKDYAGRLKIAKLSIDRNPETAGQFNVMSTPVMILFKEGKKVHEMVGALQKQEIENQLRAYLS